MPFLYPIKHHDTQFIFCQHKYYGTIIWVTTNGIKCVYVYSKQTNSAHNMWCTIHATATQALLMSRDNGTMEQWCIVAKDVIYIVNQVNKVHGAGGTGGVGCHFFYLLFFSFKMPRRRLMASQAGTYFKKGHDEFFPSGPRESFEVAEKNTAGWIGIHIIWESEGKMDHHQSWGQNLQKRGQTSQKISHLTATFLQTRISCFTWW